MIDHQATENKRFVMRGVRGAIQVEEDTAEAILEATETLLKAILKGNPDINTDDLASIFFTATDDLSSTYPAMAARNLGWSHVPLLCAREICVPGGMKRVVRILIHWNTILSGREIQHIYLGDTAKLRPDIPQPKGLE